MSSMIEVRSWSAFPPALISPSSGWMSSTSPGPGRVVAAVRNCTAAARSSSRSCERVAASASRLMECPITADSGSTWMWSSWRVTMPRSISSASSAASDSGGTPSASATTVSGVPERGSTRW